MTTIVLAKDDRGKVAGLGEKDQRAWLRFRKMIEGLERGEVFTLDYWFPRNRKLLGLHFKMLTKVFDSQEQFDDMDPMRYWLTIGAGDVDFYPNPNGSGLMAVPKSISYKSMDDEEFRDHHERVKKFLRTPMAMAYLWPHLSPKMAGDMVEEILKGFER